jgi:hypothetical protein
MKSSFRLRNSRFLMWIQTILVMMSLFLIICSDFDAHAVSSGSASFDAIVCDATMNRFGLLVAQTQGNGAYGVFFGNLYN